MFKVKCRNDKWSVSPRQLQNKDRPLEFKAFIIFVFLGTDADTISHVFLWTFFSTQTFIQLTDLAKKIRQVLYQLALVEQSFYHLLKKTWRSQIWLRIPGLGLSYPSSLKVQHIIGQQINKGTPGVRWWVCERLYLENTIKLLNIVLFSFSLISPSIYLPKQ